MSFSIEDKKNIQIVYLDKLWNPDDSNLIIEKINSLISLGKLNFVIDLSQAPYINSNGLSFLISILTRARSAGGDVVLCGVSENTKQLLLLTRLQSMFPIANDIDSAMKNFELSKA